LAFEHRIADRIDEAEMLGRKRRRRPVVEAGDRGQLLVARRRPRR
jgi:hypothetical protein